MWSGQSATMKQDGQPIGFVVPEDGAIGWVDNWAIAKSSENKELAYAFINYMIGKDVQYGWASKGGPSPANQEAADAIDPEYAASCDGWMKHPSIVSSSWNTEHLKSKGMERCLDGSKGFLIVSPMPAAFSAESTLLRNTGAGIRGIPALFLRLAART